MTSVQQRLVLLLLAPFWWCAQPIPVAAQTSDPLRAANTSSPRDTLRSFIDSSNELYDLIRKNNSFVRADYLYYDEYPSNFDPFSVGVPVNGDYDRLDLRVGMVFGDFEVSVFGTNLTDDRPIIVRDNSLGEDFSFIQPRTYGVSLTYRSLN